MRTTIHRTRHPLRKPAIDLRVSDRIHSGRDRGASVVSNRTIRTRHPLRRTVRDRVELRLDSGRVRHLRPRRRVVVIPADC